MDRHGFQVNYLAAMLKLDKLMAESGLVVWSLAGSGGLAEYNCVQCPVANQDRITEIHSNVELFALLNYCRVCGFLG